MKFTAKKHSENRHSSWTVCNKSRFELKNTAKTGIVAGLFAINQDLSAKTQRKQA
jgi:hypothetical protein